jgi:hypothetical protein
VGLGSSSWDYIPESWYVLSSLPSFNPSSSFASSNYFPPFILIPIYIPYLHLPKIDTDDYHIELKELIAMHSSLSSHGGDLKNDTVTIIGATLDLQEKVVMQVCSPHPQSYNPR